MQPQTQIQSGAGNGLDPDVINLAKAIRQTESGGNLQARGRSGEYGAYQYTPGTWQKYAGEAGINTPLEQSTMEQQNEVTYRKLKQWKDQGLNIGQIASMWNSGKPDAYLDPTYKGTNKEGARYDVPAYAKSVAIAYQTLKQGGQVQTDPSNPSSVGGFVNPNSNQNNVVSSFVNPPQIQPDTMPIPEAPKEGLMSRLIHGAGDVFKSIESPFLGVAALPTQLLAKATGRADPFANKAFGGVEATNLEGGALKATEKKLGDVAQIGSYFVPGSGIAGAVGMGALQGLGQEMSKGSSAGQVAVGAGEGALIGGLVAGGTKLAGKGIVKIGETLSGEGAQKALKGIKDAYTYALNLNVGERGFEQRTGKDLAQVLLDNNAPLGRYANGTLDASVAIEKLQQVLNPINDEVTNILQKPQGVVSNISLPDIFEQVSERIQKSPFTQAEKNKMVEQAKKVILAEIKQYGAEVEPAVSDTIKRGFWNTTFKKNITSNDALRSNVSYLVGNTLKEAEEKAIAGTDVGDVLGELNIRRGDLVDAIKRLTKLDGVRLLKGGRLGNMAGGLKGAVIGAASHLGAPGAFLGDYFGERAAEFLNNPANRIGMAQLKSKAVGFIPRVLGKAASPIGENISRVGRGIIKGARGGGLLGNLLIK